MTATEERTRPPVAVPDGDGSGPAGLRRWAADLLMGVRFALAGGREGWARTLLTAVGTGLGVAVLLLAAAVPTMLDARDQRTESRENWGIGQEFLEPGPDTLVYGHIDTGYRHEAVRGRVLNPDGARPPLPPGLREIPAHGEMVVSPALRDLLTSPDGELLRERLHWPVAGTIGDDGLAGPGELAFYLGADITPGDADAYRIDTFDTGGNVSPPLNAELLLLVIVVCVVLLVPVGAFVAMAVRLGGERRDKRLAALRLVGADTAMTHRIASGEALVGALLGLVLGAVFFVLGQQSISGIRLSSLSVFPSDVTPHPLIAALILLAVPVCAVAVTIGALRRISIEPLGVVRNAEPRRRRLWWRLLLPAAGLLLLMPLFGEVDATQTSVDTWQITAGIVALLIGVTAVLPWLVETVVRRLRGGPLPLQMAGRRLQLDSGTAARAVSGITVAVAGAIAVQMLLGPVAMGHTEETGQDLDRADALVYTRDADPDRMPELAAEVASLPGVTATLGTVTAHAFIPAEHNEEDYLSVTLTIADCATLAELARLPDGGCREGDVFLVNGSDVGVDVEPGTELNLAPPRWSLDGTLIPTDPQMWTVPGNAAEATARLSPMGDHTYGVLATPSAVDTGRMTDSSVSVLVKLDRSEPDAVEHLRNTAAGYSLGTRVSEMRSTEVDSAFASIRKAFHAGAVVVLLLIGSTLLVSTLEQLRERRRLLSVLDAFGTPRSVLGLSVLWQTVLPVALGMTLAVAGGIGLGAVLLKMISQPVSVDIAGLAVMAGMGAGVVVLVTAVSLPVLWRMMRAEGLRTE
ncbi:ABC transporter permease [Streptomyces sodiiphilus]|uniref:ABC transporter permease n=1 Tax=Streptomyces sodiiphilus TaxID=226217 RepID=A0ABN2NX82_9ACTN